LFNIHLKIVCGAKLKKAVVIHNRFFNVKEF